MNRVHGRLLRPDTSLRWTSTELVILPCLSLASGAAGLMFEMVWFYRCALLLGSGVAATGVVYSGFMAGLALGSALVTRSARRLTRPLRTYAAVELAIAASGLAMTLLLSDFTLFHLLLQTSAPGPLVAALRLVLAFAILLFPATAMGATLPVLVAALCSRGRPGTGRAVGWLYGWNTIGAVSGILSAELVWIPSIGVTATALAAASINCCLAAVSVAIDRSGTSECERRDPAEPHLPVADVRIGSLLLCASLGGAAMLALEVTWTRFLSLLIANNALAFSLMLASVLAAVSLGGLAGAAWLARRPAAADNAGTLALLAGAAATFCYGAFQYVVPQSRTLDWHHIVWLTCCLSFPSAFLSGVLFTLLADALRPASAASAAGRLVQANALGSAAGSAAAAFVLLPSLGLERSFFAVTIVYCLTGMLAHRWISPAGRGSRRVFVVAALVSLASVALFPFGLMSQVYFAKALAEHTRSGAELVATREGPHETIFLLRDATVGPTASYRLVTNGFSMSATTLKAKRYMRYFVYLPAAIGPEPLRRILVVCYGVGVTVGAATDLDSAQSIDVVEISREVAAMSDVIYGRRHNPLRDPRVRLHVDDGRLFLATTKDRYDLITGEPPPPLTPGAVNIYTREYFELMRDRLTDRGIATYWLPVGRLDGTNHASIIRAFCAVFQDCSLWNGTPSDLILMGTRSGAAAFSRQHIEAFWRNAATGEHLREIGLEAPAQIGATFVADAADLQRLTALDAPLTDDYPRRLRASALPQTDPRRRLDWVGTPFYRDLLDTAGARERFQTSSFIARVWPDDLLRETLPFFEVQRTLNRAFTTQTDFMRDFESVHLLLTHTSIERLPAWILLAGNVPGNFELMPDDGSGVTQYVHGVRALLRRDYREASGQLQAAERLGVRGIRPLVVYTLYMAGQRNAALELSIPLHAGTADERRFVQWTHSTFERDLSQ